MTRRPNGINGMADEARGLLNASVDKLDRIVELIQQGLTQDQDVYVRKIINVPATDTAAQDSVTPPPGVIWKVQRFAVTSGGGGAFAAYLDEVQPQALVDGSFTNAAIAAWGVTNGVYVPRGRTLILRFYNQPNSQVCTVNMRVTEIRSSE